MDSNVTRPMISVPFIVMRLNSSCSPLIRHGISVPFPMTFLFERAAIILTVITSAQQFRFRAGPDLVSERGQSYQQSTGDSRALGLQH